MVDYKRKPVLWIEGTRCLSNPERGVYADLVERMYALESDLYYDERDLAGFCNVTIRTFRKILQGLIDKGKIHLTEDGKLTANHVRTERETAMNIRETYRSRAVRGGKRSGEMRKNNALSEACGSSSPSPSPSPSPLNKKELPNGSSKESPASPALALDPEPPPVAKPKFRIGTKLPEDWQPTPGDIAYAQERGLDETDIGDAVANFIEHFTNGNGRNKTRGNWSLSWKRWVREQPTYSKAAIGGHAAGGNRQGNGGIVAASRRVAAHFSDPSRARPRPHWRDD